MNAWQEMVASGNGDITTTKLRTPPKRGAAPAQTQAPQPTAPNTWLQLLLEKIGVK